MKKLLFLGVFALLSAFSQVSLAQITVKLSEEKTMVIDAKETNDDQAFGVFGKTYLKETADTIHCYTYKVFSNGICQLIHARIPKRYFSKAEVAITNAEITFTSRESFSNAFDVVTLNCRKEQDIYAKDSKNQFFLTIYNGNKPAENQMNCSVQICFQDKTEAKSFFERMTALNKK
jgi:hypothetical protein